MTTTKNPPADACQQLLRFRPVFVPRVWGGDRILTELHSGASATPPIGESWEVSDVGDDPDLHSAFRCATSSGEEEEFTLRQLLECYPADVLGSAIHDGTPAPRLPLLYKFLDAREHLSVQVHPSDEVVARLGIEGAGKTEAWIVLDADPDAFVIYGYEEGVSQEDYLRLAQSGRGQEGLRRYPVQRGDIVYLPAGTVHAIGAGILLAEIQQSSDTTYRIYDWDRVGLDGQPRQLHLDESARVPEPADAPPCPLPAAPESSPGFCDRLQGAPFQIGEFRATGSTVQLPAREDRFAILTLFDGQVEVQQGDKSATLDAGGVLFVPAAARSGELTVTGTGWGMCFEPNPAPAA